MDQYNQLNENGFSLIEVIASIIILTIILLSIFPLLIQSAKTTADTENIFDATYIAQKEMEKLYLHSKNPISNRIDSITDCSNYPDICYSEKDSSGNFLIGDDGEAYFIKQEVSTNYCTKLKITDVPSYPKLTRILIQVYDGACQTGTLKAQMENTLEWRNT